MSGALVLSGSIGSTSEMWEPQLPALADYELVLVDHPGHGRGPVPTGPTGLPDLGRNVLAALDERGIERAHYCGLSLGGAVGMWLAAHAPERIDRLVLACTRATFGDPAGWDERAAAVRAGGMDAVVDTVIERWFTPQFDGRGRWREMMRSIDPEGYARCCEALRDADLRGDLAAIRAPTLVITGAEDVAVPRADAQLLVDRIPGARHLELAGAAHIANVERPGPFTAALLAHLEET